MNGPLTGVNNQISEKGEAPDQEMIWNDYQL